MAEEKTRIDKVREYLYEAEEPVRPKTIAEVIGESSLNVGKDLHRLKEQGQAESEGDGLWKMTHEGKEALEGGGGREKGKGEKEREISETVPSQCDGPCCEVMDLGESFGGSLSHSRAVV